MAWKALDLGAWEKACLEKAKIPVLGPGGLEGGLEKKLGRGFGQGQQSPICGPGRGPGKGQNARFGKGRETKFVNLVEGLGKAKAHLEAWKGVWIGGPEKGLEHVKKSLIGGGGGRGLERSIQKRQENHLEVWMGIRCRVEP